jgi:hypothetical protein
MKEFLQEVVKWLVVIYLGYCILKYVIHPVSDKIRNKKTKENVKL